MRPSTRDLQTTGLAAPWLGAALALCAWPREAGANDLSLSVATIATPVSALSPEPPPAEAATSTGTGSRRPARTRSSRHHRRARVNLRAYRAHVRGWHDAGTAAPVARTPEGQLVLRLYSINTHARAEIAPAATGERFDLAAREQIANVLGDPRTHREHEIDPSLIEALYQVAQHFEAPEIRVISGYRAGAGHSNHAAGRAVDFIVPGASDGRVAEFARSLGNVGVGLYPVSGFVHLDVRDRATSWVDVSGPGRRARYTHRRHRRTASRGRSAH